MLPSAESTGPALSSLPNLQGNGGELQNPMTCQLPALDFEFFVDDLGAFPDWEWAAAFKLPNDADMDLPDLPDLD